MVAARQPTRLHAGAEADPSMRGHPVDITQVRLRESQPTRAFPPAVARCNSIKQALIDTLCDGSSIARVANATPAGNTHSRTIATN